MPLTSGVRLGPYEIVSPIGAGGMGEVYKATDTRLSRTVAIKVLPTHFAHDPEMKQRFEREAQTIAGLNHPNICTLFDVGEARIPDPDGRLPESPISYLVMEYVEGETMAERLTRGPLPIGDALSIAIEILDALDRAHRQGIVHRDLKPANIMLAKGGSASARPDSGRTRGDSGQATKGDGSPATAPDAGDTTRVGSGRTTRTAPGARSAARRTKILDFGLAKWSTSSDADVAAQSTRMDVTSAGTILGTLQYMAPEQVEGKEADARTDVFAFGAVFYEMLTGRKAFEGKSQASLIAAIMKAEPRPVSHIQPLAPQVLEYVIGRCLVKDAEERWQNTHSLKLKLQSIAQQGLEAAQAVEAPRNRWREVAVGTALLVALGTVGVPAYLYWRGPTEPDAIQFRHTIAGVSDPDVALSPDGKTIAFVAKPDTSGAASLYVRPVRDVTAVKLAGTDNAAQPFWSPDSRFIGYVSSGKLRKVQASGGAPADLCDAPEFSGGTWSEYQGGTIVFGTSKGLLAVSAEGGKTTPVTEIGAGEGGHLWPSFLPDGKHALYLAWADQPEKRAAFVASLDAKDRVPLGAMDSNPVYAAPGYVLFHRQTTLFARPFDPTKLHFTGEPAHLADDVSSGVMSHGNFDASQNGILIYYQGAGATTVGRGGIAPEQFAWRDRQGPRTGDALASGNYGDMDLSPDGKYIAITKQDPGAAAADIWVIDWEKVIQHRVTADPADAVGPVWSPDGVRLAFTSWRKGNADIYVKNANGVGDETPLLESPANEIAKDWSRDGKYIAFEFGKDRFQDIYVLPLESDGKPGKPFPLVVGHFQKNEPQFSKDGKWLAYTSDENESGRFQVYVISFPKGDIKQQVSTDGGGQPRWSWDGKQIYYRTLNNQFAEVDLKLGAKVESSVPRLNGYGTTVAGTVGDPVRHMWSVAADGRFLIRVPIGASSGGTGGTAAVVPPIYTPAGQNSGANPTRSTVTSGLTALLHWTSTLKKGGQ